AGGAGVARGDSPALQLPPEPSEGAQSVEAPPHVAAMTPHQPLDNRLQDRAMLGGQAGARDAELAVRAGFGSGGIAPAGRDQVAQCARRDEAQVHGQGLEQQLAIDAVLRHGSSPLLSDPSRPAPRACTSWTRPDRLERSGTGPIKILFIVAVRPALSHGSLLLDRGALRPIVRTARHASRLRLTL